MPQAFRTFFVVKKSRERKVCVKEKICLHLLRFNVQKPRLISESLKKLNKARGSLSRRLSCTTPITWLVCLKYKKQ